MTGEPTRHLDGIGERLRRTDGRRSVEATQFASFSREVRRFAGGVDSPQVLSVSCGDGVFDFIAGRDLNDPDIDATDIVSNPVAQADQELIRGVCRRWTFNQVEPDGDLPFTSNTFDLVFSQDVIEHTRRPLRFMREQHRVLKPGGRVIVGTPNLFRPASALAVLLGRRRFPDVIGWNEEIGNYTHEVEYFEESLILVLEEAGFTNVAVDRLFFGFHPLGLRFSEHPTGQVSSRMAHFLMATAEKDG
jgi:2-polyprenyl-3-methyl-5-hydroxy-6-metoxy-1,4-benzoquinol methylase